MPSYCTSCGFKNEDDAGFCESCGVAITRGPSRAEQGATRSALAGTSQALAPTRSTRWGLWLVVSAVLVGAIGVAVAEFVLPSRPISSALARLGLPSLVGGADGSVLYLVGTKGRYGYVDRNGTEVIAFNYEQPPLLGYGTIKVPQLFQRSVAPFPVYSKGGWILLDRRGTQIGNVKFDFLNAPSDDPAESCVLGVIGERRVCIDATGNDMLGSGFDMPPKGVRLHRIVENKKWGLADETGKIIVPPTYSLISPFRANATATLARFDDGKFGLLDLQGKESSRRRYTMAVGPRDGIWPVKADRSWALADLSGEVIAQLAPDIREVGEFSEGVARAVTSGGEGLIDKAGKWILLPRKGFLHIRNFVEGRAAVGPLGNIGVIGIDGGFIIPPVLGAIAQFAGGAAVASVGEDIWLVGASGRVLWPQEMAHAAGAQQGKAGVFASRWQLVKGNKSELGSEWEFTDTRARITVKGNESELGLRFMDGSPNRITVEGKEMRYWLFADMLAFVEDNGGVIGFRRMGNAGPPPQVQEAKSAANETIKGMISKILPLGGGSGGNSPVGKWDVTVIFDTQEQKNVGVWEFFSDKTWSVGPVCNICEGTYSVLDDGRVKLSTTMMGQTLFVYMGHMEGADLILEVQEEKKVTMRLKKKS